jgi:hypothetical protein
MEREPETSSQADRGNDALDMLTLKLPAEVSIAQAARILNCDRKTVRRYIDGGMIEWRDKATPGSTQLTFALKRESVVAIRTEYRTGKPTPPTPSHQHRAINKRLKNFKLPV